MLNIDYLAAKYATAVIDSFNEKYSDLDNSATTSLNILHEQGIYAMFVWLKEKDVSQRKALVDGMQQFFADDLSPIPCKKGGLDLKEVRERLTQNPKTMFLAHKMLELFLIYVRHSAKCREE